MKESTVVSFIAGAVMTFIISVSIVAGIRNVEKNKVLQSNYNYMIGWCANHNLQAQIVFDGNTLEIKSVECKGQTP